MNNPITLSVLNGLVREVITLSMPDCYWVQAELASVRESRGHCYMELIETDESRTPIAQARACCWKSAWQRLAPHFAQVTGQTLHAGMQVLLCVKANFHEAFGFSWIVTDIDPTYTMGDMARRRQEIIKILKGEGVYDLNKSLQISHFATHIAVISSATAAGYGDFCNQLEDNGYGFRFTTRLFPAIMQGERVEESVIAALDSIHRTMCENPSSPFDLVVIIRGGGSTSDLSGFDTLALAENVANFPLPVITGVGHERDLSVLDMIACRSVKTPTAVAAFLIDNLAETLGAIEESAQRITSAVQRRMETERLRLDRIERYLSSAFAIMKVQAERRLDAYAVRMSSAVNQRLFREHARLDAILQRLPLVCSARMQYERHRMMLLEQRCKAVDPVNILRRGYSIVLHDGHSVTSAPALQSGDRLSIVFADGKTNVVVE